MTKKQETILGEYRFRDVRRLKRRIRTLVILIVLAAIMLFLYERQLGAISFFLLSIFFFSLAIKQLSGSSFQKQKSRQSSFFRKK